MTASAIQTRKDLEARLIIKAQNDPAFRESLLMDPRATVERELGISLPKRTKVQVLHESGDTLYLALPPTAKEGELSDLELEAVAGGKGGTWRDDAPNAVAGVRG